MSAIEWSTTEGLFVGDSDHVATAGNFKYMIRHQVADSVRSARTGVTVVKLDTDDREYFYASSVEFAKEWCALNDQSNGAWFASLRSDNLNVDDERAHTDLTQGGPDA